MTRLDVDVMQKFVDIYRNYLANNNVVGVSAKTVMSNYVEDIEVLLAYIKELEAKSEAV